MNNNDENQLGVIEETKEDINNTSMMTNSNNQFGSQNLQSTTELGSFFYQSSQKDLNTIIEETPGDNKKNNGELSPNSLSKRKKNLSLNININVITADKNGDFAEKEISADKNKKDQLSPILHYKIRDFDVNTISNRTSYSVATPNAEKQELIPQNNLFNTASFSEAITSSMPGSRRVSAKNVTPPIMARSPTSVQPVTGQLIDFLTYNKDDAIRKSRLFKNILKTVNKGTNKKPIVKALSLPDNALHEVKKEPSIENLDESSDFSDFKSKRTFRKSEIITEDLFEDEVSYDDYAVITPITKKSFGIINPDATLKTFWDLITLCLVLYQAIVIPYRLSFDADATGFLYIIETIMDGIFLADLAINFNTGYFNKGTLVMLRGMIIKNYIRGWFFPDILASFPYTWVFSNSTVNSTPASGNKGALAKTPQLLRLLKTFRFLRILRLLKILKLKKILIKFEDHAMSDMLIALFGFLKLLAPIVFIAHWIACLFYYVGQTELDSSYESWLVISGIVNSPNFDKYIVSLYWTFTTMTTVGYGDVHPYTSNERMFGMLAMVISCGVFAYIVGSIGNVIARINTLAAQYREKMTNVTQFLVHKEVPKELRMKIRRYLDYIWDYKKKYKIDEQEVLEMLNQNLRDEMIIFLNGKILQNVSVFDFFELNFLSQLSFILKSETFAPYEHIIEEGSQGQTLYFIIIGKVSVIQKKTYTYIKELLKDQTFGEISFFSSLPRQCTIRAKDFTEVLYIQKNKFLELIEYFPKAKIENSIDKKKDISCLKMTCYICHKPNHISIECPKFCDYKGNLRQYIKKHLPSNTSFIKDSQNNIEKEDHRNIIPNSSRGLLETERESEKINGSKVSSPSYFTKENNERYPTLIISDDEKVLKNCDEFDKICQRRYSIPMRSQMLARRMDKNENSKFSQLKLLRAVTTGIKIPSKMFNMNDRDSNDLPSDTSRTIQSIPTAVKRFINNNGKQTNIFNFINVNDDREKEIELEKEESYHRKNIVKNDAEKRKHKIKMAWVDEFNHIDSFVNQSNLNVNKNVSFITQDLSLSDECETERRIPEKNYENSFNDNFVIINDLRNNEQNTSNDKSISFNINNADNIKIKHDKQITLLDEIDNMN